MGGIESETMTENEHDELRKPLLVAVHVTKVVEATAKLLPDAGLHSTLSNPAFEEAMTSYVTFANWLPIAATALMMLGHLIFGLTVTCTVTIDVHEDTNEYTFVAEQVM